MSYLLDTNVLSELRRPKADPSVLAWFDGVRSEELYVSVLVVGELRRGALLLGPGDPTAGAAIADWISALVVDFADRLLPVDSQVVQRWAEINVPAPLPAVDSLMAATALVHGLSVVTRNVSDFEASGVQVINPFVA